MGLSRLFIVIARGELIAVCSGKNWSSGRKRKTKTVRHSLADGLCEDENASLEVVGSWV